MHVGGERRWRRAPRQPALLLANFAQGQAEPAELLGHRRKQILGLAQLVEIFEEEPVLPVVAGSALGASAPAGRRTVQRSLAYAPRSAPSPGSVSELTSVSQISRSVISRSG